jgi:hypothetical protein
LQQEQASLRPIATTPPGNPIEGTSPGATSRKARWSCSGR